MKFPTFQSTQTRLNLLLAIYFAAIFNYALYAKIWQIQEHVWANFLFTVPVFIFLACWLVFTLLALPFVHKIIVPLLLVISASVSYNSIFLDVYFNHDMLTNVMQTTVSESSRLMTVPFIAWIVCLGVVPAILYCRTKIIYRTWWRECLARMGAGCLSILGVLVIAAFFYQDYASVGRNNPTLKNLIVPSNFIGAGISKYKHWKRDNLPYQTLDTQVKQIKTTPNRRVFVMIVGETTRAINWGLNGYARQTTPLLAKRGDSVINFHNVSSCNTFTAGSVPCMFSHMTRTEFNVTRAEKQDNILDMMQRAGIKIVWLNNNSSCKGVCKNTPYIDVTKMNPPEFCHNGECLDNVMLPELDKVLNQIDQSKQDTLIVLHTIGSHGPTYYERYTPEYRQFTPTCDTNEINRCSNQELVNTYDNTILYVDQFINTVIAHLEQHKDWESAVMFASDHGESLGEKGVYLHSTPYEIAPKEQTSIPMIMWFSPTWLQNEKINAGCLHQNAQTQTYSHDNVFSTLFSAMNLDKTQSQTYRADLDILAACR
ncbi:phosphoethanolamine--lipid A transferase [Kingella kingae]|uniref:phosphoethanolamine transferase n=1 Tax=Kingella kingae TaxID=504 RepID=UPI0002586035|nr:phosphoethanolamine--lipid A transferase [Kingella kingae]EIC12983.1 phosphoethanolamine transferase EptA [Kingella kingae PYKK081]MBD3613673.1 phosphoethanolamine--lipid A transferase [Kingella kingae]MBD3631988.1 phosphoethanolamine--lipid A transferase [Kingella kingae]MBD3659304.1 phosphoethanolamine--lipid A transferase [Kingella kingae]MDK4569377.1 phosphoethanolamine--lipid A transferase [Kingella kingae]